MFATDTEWMGDTEKNEPQRYRNAVARTPCEVCRAAPGEPCKDPRGNPRAKPHIARRYEDHKRHCDQCGRPRQA